MNPTNSQFQFSDSENSQNNDIISPQSSEQATEDDIYHVTNAAQPTNSSANPQHQIQFVHPSVFIFRPPNDFCQYYVKCKEVHYDAVACLLSDSLNGRNIQFNENEFIFFYRQQHNNQFYRVLCEIVSPLLINNCLNKNFLGIELQQDMGKEHLAFSFDQKKILEFHLKQYLSQHLLN